MTLRGLPLGGFALSSFFRNSIFSTLTSPSMSWYTYVTTTGPCTSSTVEGGVSKTQVDEQRFNQTYRQSLALDLVLALDPNSSAPLYLTLSFLPLKDLPSSSPFPPPPPPPAHPPP